MTMKESGVYKITIGDNLFYVGSAVDLRRRESKHRTTLIKGTHYNLYMKNAWDKYGVMSFEILECCEALDTVALEQKYLDEVFGQKHCMNILPTAGSRYGFKSSAKSCKKLSDSIMGHVVSDETRQKISATLTGRRLSTEQKQLRADKISISNGDDWVHPNKGKSVSGEQKKRFRDTVQSKVDNGWVSPKKGVAMSNEQKEKLSLAHTGKKLSEEHKARISESLKARKLVGA